MCVYCLVILVLRDTTRPAVVVFDYILCMIMGWRYRQRFPEDTFSEMRFMLGKFHMVGSNNKEIKGEGEKAMGESLGLAVADVPPGGRN